MICGSVKKHGTTYEGTRELRSITKDSYFTHPKPTKLLKHIIELASNKDDIVLDFFGGSGTTAVSASDLNRQFITVEINEDNFNMVSRIKKLLYDKDVLKSFITCNIE